MQLHADTLNIGRINAVRRACASRRCLSNGKRGSLKVINRTERECCKQGEKPSQVSRRQQLMLTIGGGFLPFLTKNEALAAAATDEEGTTTYVDLLNDTSLTPSQKKVLLNNLKIQRQNRVPEGFPSFIREGFDIRVLGEGFVQDDDGLIYKDFVVGTGSSPSDDQQVIFDYTGYNENGARIDSTYLRGQPAETRLGIGGLIPGFELGLKSMRVGGKRRLIIPPQLGPPVGPSTFFSAKQCEVFDVELRAVKSCQREQFAMFSQIVCE